ncbi:MAG: DUF1295 domain-containing protein, partial [Leptospiraceae bacterium]|nr:DUF1295 domain-containing protein [Leptospiraceae bacterium]
LCLTPMYSNYAIKNTIIQLTLFLFVACIPAYFTNKMSYVDVAWPWGLVAIGVQAIAFGDGNPTRTYIIGSLFIIAGLRMGLMALFYLMSGALKKDLPRYQFQRIQWKMQGFTNEAFSLQYEILVQGLANASFLALPAILQAFNPNPEISHIEIIGYSLWAISFILEMVSDFQKANFVKETRKQNLKNQICNVGLWKYSRHPNYFFEWMVWNSLIISSIPSLFELEGKLPIYIIVLIGIGLLFISKLLYTTLVDYTGARPAEYYSIRKRPAYKEYQKTTNMFFPGPSKNI